MTMQITDDRTQRLPVLAIVRRARLLLLDAQFRLDDAGFSSPALDELSAEAGLLVSAWSGREPPVDPREQMFTEDAIRYRRKLGITY